MFFGRGGGGAVGGREHPRGRDELRTIENGLASTSAGRVRLPKEASCKSFLSYKKP